MNTQSDIILTTTTILLAKEEIYIVDNKVYMMAGCQVGRSPSMLAARELLQTYNTNKEKREQKTSQLQCSTKRVYQNSN